MNKDVNQSIFGNELMMLYGRVNLSQGEFAHLVGVSSVALRKWESGASCPKAESLKRVVEILTSKGAFAQGEEQTEAMHLWDLANQRGLKVPFDERWFRAVMQGLAGVTTVDTSVEIMPNANPVSSAYADLPTNHGQDEYLVWPAASADAHRTLPHISRDLVLTPDRVRRRLRWPRVMLVVLVVLTITGAAGALFFYTQDHPTNQTYPGYLSGMGKLVFFDPLSREHGSEWSSLSFKDLSGACQFSGGAYHASLQTNTPFRSCPTSGIFTDFAFEVQLTIVQGDCGGIVFRMQNSAYFYFFCICESGTSYIRKHVSNSDADTPPLLFWKLNTPAVHTGAGDPNKIAVVASGCGITFYVNEQLIDSEHDCSYTWGNIALMARLNQGTGHTTDVAFRNARLWRL